MTRVFVVSGYFETTRLAGRTDCAVRALDERPESTNLIAPT
ncbi:hypothetical protein [Bradyrhizobium acaciae]|nr:hypothetical protein [Bradyrhizobium acaciae]